MRRGVFLGVAVALQLSAVAPSAIADEGTCGKGLRGYRRSNGDVICLSQRMAEFLTCLTETSKGVGEEKTNASATKTTGVDVQLQADGKATVVRGKASVEVDTRNYEQSQQSLRKLFAPDLVSRCAAPGGLTTAVSRTSASTTNPNKKEIDTGSAAADRSLLQLFKSGVAQEFAGPGTMQPPSCEQLKDGALQVQIPSGFRSFAGCYVELDDAIDLTKEPNLVLRLELRQAAKRLEVKIESGESAEGRREWFVHRAAAPAGTYEIRLKADAPPEVLAKARRLVIAIAGAADSREGNAITLRR